MINLVNSQFCYPICYPANFAIQSALKILFGKSETNPLKLTNFNSFSDQLFFFQIIELRLPSFFDNFDPRAAAANLPSSELVILR